MQRLAEWPDVDVFRDEIGLTSQDIDYHILLARFLRSQPTTTSPLIVQSIRMGKARRPKQLLDVLEAIESGTSQRFASTLTKFLQHHAKAEVNERNPSSSISIEASLLWQVAQRQRSISWIES